MASRGCKLHPDNFCYVCGYYIGGNQIRAAISKGTKYCVAYEKYFKMKIGDQERSWAPHVICGTCRSALEGWLRDGKRQMPFAIPRVWREPTNHHDDCYFCMVDIAKYKKPSDRFKLIYPDIPSSRAPVPHSAELPVPDPPSAVIDDVVDDDDDLDDSKDLDWEDQTATVQPRQFSKAKLNDLVRDLELTKSGAELLASRLQEMNLLDASCSVTVFRKRHEAFSQYYTYNGLLCYCHDVDGVFHEIGLEHNPQQWRLFIDSSIHSLKAVLLHNGNRHPSIPVAHSASLKETYDVMQTVLDSVSYQRYQWDICGDFKALGILLGFQGGYVKYPCFLCLWDSRDTNKQYTKDWPRREEIQPGVNNVRFQPLVAVEKVLLPPLHIKLGLAKQFVKALSQTGEVFKHLQGMFPKLSDAKLKGGVFIGPQVRQMLECAELENKMTEVEKRAWCAFRNVVSQFLGNNKAPNYVELVEELVTSFREMNCRMSPKLHYLHSHLDFFRPNLGAVSEEHGERFHQDINEMESRYQGRWDEAMMGDYIWNMVREDTSSHKRKRRSSQVFRT